HRLQRGLTLLETAGLRDRVTVQVRIQMPDDLDRDASDVGGELVRRPALARAPGLRRGLIDRRDECDRLAAPFGHPGSSPSPRSRRSGCPAVGPANTPSA